MNEKDVAKILLAFWHGYGIELDTFPENFDEPQIYYISVPSSSDLINSFGEEMSGITLAKRFLKSMNSYMDYHCTVKSRIRDEHWTRELRDIAYAYFLSL